jgi:lipoprotein-releasing system ATP-binding protein
MILTKNLEYTFSTGSTIEFPDIIVKAEEPCLVLGKSGVGKTTLLHLLALILRPKIGSIIINEQETSTLKATSIAQFRANNIGIVFQKPYFVKSLSVRENILLGCLFSKNKIDENYLFELANTLKISEILSKNTTKISLGEQQRVSIARALINKPKLILADEPTSSLDDENCKNVIELLANQAKIIGASLVIVTHDQRLKSAFKNQITLI